MERVAVFIDGNNIANSSRRYGVVIDYGALLAWIANGGPKRPDGSVMRELRYEREIVSVRVYLGPNGSNGYEKRERFIALMEDLGVEVVEAIEEGDGSKTAVDRDIIIDALLLAHNNRIDRFLLLSGDGGFTRLVGVLESLGVQVEVCAFGDVSSALRQAARRFWDLSKLVGIAIVRMSG